MAAPMHDVGKIGIEDKILKKPGKLDKDEWQIMMKHSEMGSQILGAHDDDLLNVASIMAFEHHERWNGKGYPLGKKKEEIHLYARIVAVADVFDALTSVRPYKNVWTVEDSLSLIKSERGEHFDPKLVDAFVNIFDKILEIKLKYKD